MPAKNKTKTFEPNSFYHLYNRGYNRQEIFLDKQDYATFLYLLKRYLDPNFREKRKTPQGEVYWNRPNTVSHQLKLIAYCLMPNHFHLLVFQKNPRGITKLMRRIASNYATYFNKKYQKEGSPFQGTYRAVKVTSEEQLLHLSRYIHLNPESLWCRSLADYPYSSYSFYIKRRSCPRWLFPEEILAYFNAKTKNKSSYFHFVESFAKLKPHQKEKSILPYKDLLLE